jgi:hypothetical protein
VFGPGTTTEEIVTFIRTAVARVRALRP